MEQPLSATNTQSMQRTSKSVDATAGFKDTPKWLGDVPKPQSILSPFKYFEFFFFFDESIMEAWSTCKRVEFVRNAN